MTKQLCMLVTPVSQLFCRLSRRHQSRTNSYGSHLDRIWARSCLTPHCLRILRSVEAPHHQQVYTLNIISTLIHIQSGPKNKPAYFCNFWISHVLHVSFPQLLEGHSGRQGVGLRSWEGPYGLGSYQLWRQIYVLRHCLLRHLSRDLSLESSRSYLNKIGTFCVTSFIIFWRRIITATKWLVDDLDKNHACHRHDRKIVRLRDRRQNQQGRLRRTSM